MRSAPSPLCSEVVPRYGGWVSPNRSEPQAGASDAVRGARRNEREPFLHFAMSRELVHGRFHMFTAGGLLRRSSRT
jgi:hypothetical protein